MLTEDGKVAGASQTTQYDTDSTLQRTLTKLTHLDLTGRVARVQYDTTAMQANGEYCDVFVGTISMQASKDPSDRLATVPKLKVAIKRMRVHIQKEREFDKLLAKELYVWSKLDHPNILPLQGFALEGAYPLVISEWLENGTVREYLQSHPQQDVGPMIVKIADAVNYLHEQDVVHSDLKADNILIGNHGEPLSVILAY
ncbi:kinase-like protein [Fomitiporia mediterranea MF3/22]|uniref:kinase-like protein n=1 Tax=Fomitiporia mediterranea (strain MF3/22) TaxID=694068 RepID=UPI000440896F|nr:kinase-like protein [Fomitiporia mediterranea MF3/22]EJC99186.1 kinase-like protein [Fomitiporia mediterranea MF3/22]